MAAPPASADVSIEQLLGQAHERVHLPGTSRALLTLLLPTAIAQHSLANIVILLMPPHARR